MNDPKRKQTDRTPRSKPQEREITEAEREIIGRADTERAVEHADGDDGEPPDRQGADAGEHDPDDDELG